MEPRMEPGQKSHDCSKMASSVLERKEVKRYSDDTISLTCTVAGVKPFQSHVEYIIRVQKGGPGSEDAIETCHRYSDFSTLHQSLTQTSGVNLPIPPKKLFGSNDKQTVAERQQGLQKLLDAILLHPVLCHSLEFKRFLDPVGYSEDFIGRAFQNVSMFFRSQPDLVVEEQLVGMGWRIRKHFFLMANRKNSKAKKLLSWMEPGPDMGLSEKELESATRVLATVQHPNIVTAESVWCSSSGLLVIRPSEKASLKDCLYGTDPLDRYLKKYSLASRRTISSADIARYGRQILEALQFLNEKGFVLGHVHAGNVMVDSSGNCRLTELENSLLGLPSVYRPYMVQTKKIRSTELQAVYSFGHLLYELAAGCPLGAAFMDAPPPSASMELQEVLKRLLSQEKIKEGLPGISQLLEIEFFKSAWYTAGTVKPAMKVGSKLREALKAAREAGEQRLYQDQKRLAQQLRLAKAQQQDTVPTTEEEKKKRYKQKKKQRSAQNTEEEDTSYPTTALQSAKPPPSASATSASSSKGVASSSSSRQTAKKASPAAPPPPPPPGNPPPPPSLANDQSPPPPSSGGSTDRGALLSSIQGFSKAKLKTTATNDRSAPKV